MSEETEPAKPGSWIEVVERDGRIWAHIYVNGGKTGSTQHVETRREVEDLAAHYGIDRHEVRYGDVELP